MKNEPNKTQFRGSRAAIEVLKRARPELEMVDTSPVDNRIKEHSL